MVTVSHFISSSNLMLLKTQWNQFFIQFKCFIWSFYLFRTKKPNSITNRLEPLKANIPNLSSPSFPLRAGLISKQILSLRQWAPKKKRSKTIIIDWLLWALSYVQAPVQRLKLHHPFGREGFPVSDFSSSSGGLTLLLKESRKIVRHPSRGGRSDPKNSSETQMGLGCRKTLESNCNSGVCSTWVAFWFLVFFVVEGNFFTGERALNHFIF